LFGHLHAIAGTKESQELFDGTKESAKPLVDDVRRRIAGSPAPTEVAKDKADDKADDKLADKLKDKLHEKVGEKVGEKVAEKLAGKPADRSDKAAAHKDPDKDKEKSKDEEITSSERRRLRRLISSAEGASAPR
jgi:hypothetical protein